MNSQIKRSKYVSLDDFLKDDDNVHIDIEQIECITYDDENTGNVSELTTYLHGSVRKVLQQIDLRIKIAIENKNLATTSL